ncbi:MAG: hypothetical protein ACHP65_06160 [Legionellales bacterium]
MPNVTNKLTTQHFDLGLYHERQVQLIEILEQYNDFTQAAFKPVEPTTAHMTPYQFSVLKKALAAKEEAIIARNQLLELHLDVLLNCQQQENTLRALKLNCSEAEKALSLAQNGLSQAKHNQEHYGRYDQGLLLTMGLMILILGIPFIFVLMPLAIALLSLAGLILVGTAVATLIEYKQAAAALPIAEAQCAECAVKAQQLQTDVTQAQSHLRAINLENTDQEHRAAATSLVETSEQTVVASVADAMTEKEPTIADHSLCFFNNPKAAVQGVDVSEKVSAPSTR